jgi:hypothetical protein
VQPIRPPSRLRFCRAPDENKCRCSKADNKNVKSCAASKGTACTLDACRDKCAAHNGFVCAWYAYDAAERDCYLYETCKNEAADADYTQYLLEPTPAAVAGAWPGAPISIWHMHSEQHRRTTSRTSFISKAGIDSTQTSQAPTVSPSTLSPTIWAPPTVVAEPPTPVDVPPEGAPLLRLHCNLCCQ